MRPTVLRPPYNALPRTVIAVTERDREILRLALPAIATLAAEPLYVLVDTAIVGHLGTAALGGLAVASAVLVLCFMVFNFLAYGTTARVAFLTGARQGKTAAQVAAQGLWICAGLGSALVAVVALGARTFSRALGAEGAILDAATTYLSISAVGAPAVLVALVGTGYLRGVRDTKTPLVIVIVANVFNVVVELILVYGLDYGVAGSAWGTVAAQWGAAVVFLYVVGRRVSATGASLRPVRREILGLLVTGRHLLVRTGSLLAALTLATSTATRIGATSLGGHQIASQIFGLLALLVDGLAIAAQALVGSNLGAGNPDEARETSARLLTWGLGAGVALAVVVAALSGVVPRIFTPDPAVVDRAQIALLWLALLQIPAAAVFVLDGVLIGASDTRFQQWANVAACAAFVPCAALVLRFDLGIGGLWAGLMVWMLVRLAANYTRFVRGTWATAST
jgi:putative MATE family efflux protein